MRIGTTRFLVFALLSGIAGAVVFLALRFGDPVPMIGASGAVSGLMGGAFRFFFAAMDRGGFDQFRSDPKSVPLMSVTEVFRDKRFQTLALVIIMINIVMSVAATSISSGDGIAWQSHLGGFVFGLLTFHIFEPPKRVRPNLKIVPPTLH
jgi:membrane associated rhomboid family serine protease